MVITFANQVAETPEGSPDTAPIPVAPVVVWVIFVNAVLIHTVGAEEAVLTAFFGVTLIVPVAFNVSQPPVNGIL